MIEVGRLLRSNISGCVVGCKLSQENIPAFGSLVRIPLTEKPFYQVFALVYDINVLDDGLVRQLITAEGVSDEVILDNRLNRNVPLELSALFVGYQLDGEIYHLLPPKPPLALDSIYLCSQEDLCHFCGAGRFGYFRHILRLEDLTVGELLAAHLKDVSDAQETVGVASWIEAATREVITLLRDDYSNLMQVLGALSDARLEYPQPL